MKNNNTTVVISYYNENLNWLESIRPIFEDIKVYTKCNPDSPYNVPVNVGNEASAFLLYIIEHYDNLRDYSIFLHGHEHSWHHEGSMIDIISDIKDMKTYFFNLNNYRLGYILTNPQMRNLAVWYNDYLQEELGPFSDYGDWTYGHFGCAQFIVHKSLILSRTKKFYENLYNWILTTPLDSGISGRFMEWTWHLIWNQVPPEHPNEMNLENLK